MTYKVRLWVDDSIVKCCSGICTEQSCPRVGICKETEIEDVNDYVECQPTYPEPPELNYCPRCGSDSVYQSRSNGAMKCEKCGLECHVIEEVDEG